MSAAFRKLERALSRRAYLEVQGNDALWREHGKRLRRWPLRIAAKVLAVFFGAIIIGAGLLMFAIGVPCLLTVVHFGCKILNETRTTPAWLTVLTHFNRDEFSPENGTTLGLFALSCGIFGWGAMLSSTISKELWRSRELALLAYLPNPDSYLKSRLQVTVLGIAGILMIWSFVSYGYLAWWLSFGLRRILLGSFLGLFEGVAVAATIAMVVGRVGLFFCLGVGGFIALTSGAVGMFGPLIKAHTEGWLWIAFTLSPPGWINAAFAYGLIDGNPLGWLWLTPAFCLALAAYRRFQTPFAIREFISHPRGELEAVPEPVCASFKKNPIRFFQKPREIPPELRPLPDRRRIAAGINIQARERDPNWLGPIVSRFFNPSEWVLMDCLFSATPNWSSYWRWLNWISLAVIALLAIPIPLALAPLLLLPGQLFFSIVGIASWTLVIFERKPAVSSTGMPIFCWAPTTPIQLCRFLAKLQLLFTLIAAPWVLLYGTLVAWRLGEPPLRGLCFAALCLYAVVVLHPWWLLLAIASRTSKPEMIDIRRWPFLVVVVLLGTLSAFSLLGLLHTRLLPDSLVLIRPVCALVMPICSLTIWYLEIRYTMRRSTDWG